MTQPVRETAWGGAMRLLVEGEQHLAAGLRNGLEAEGLRSRLDADPHAHRQGGRVGPRSMG